MVRTTYYYGGVNGLDSPPVFDQIVDGTVWSMVNTTEDYALGLTSYYEGIFEAKARTMTVCIGSNMYTDSDPFLSALEVVTLENSLYNTTDFNNYGLRLVARHSFGYNGSNLRYVLEKGEILNASFDFPCSNLSATREFDSFADMNSWCS